MGEGLDIVLRLRDELSPAIEKARGNAAAALAQIEKATGPVTSSMERLTRSLSGQNILDQAKDIVLAVNGIGGATKLTEAEAAMLNPTLQKALDKYRALGQEAPQAMRDLEAATRQAESVTGLFQERWAAFTASAGAAYIGLRQAGQALGGLLSDASAQEDALVRVNTALQAQGTLTPQLAAQYEQLASQFQRTTVFGDELVSEMQALLIQVGNVMPGQMEAALTASTNLAAGLRIDLRTATMLVGKTFEGETGTLKRYGIVIDEAALKAGGAEAVLQAINDKFGGQATAQAATYSGQMQVLGNQYGDVKEKAGAMLAQAIIPLLEAFLSLSPQTQTVVSAVVILGGVLGPVALGFSGIFSAVSLLIPVLSAAAAVAIPAVTAALTALAPFLLPAGAIIAGVAAVYLAWKNWDKIAAIAQAVYVGVKTWLVDKFDAIVASVRAKVDAVTGFFSGMYDKVVGNSYVPDMIALIAQHFQRLDAVMVQPTQQATVMVQQRFSALVTSIGGIMAGLPQVIANALQGGGNVLASVGNYLGTQMGTRLVGAATKAISGLSAGISGILSAGLSMFGPLIGPILGPLITKALTKIWNGIKGLFGGPDEKELEGRDAAAQFRAELALALTDMDKLEVQTLVAQGANLQWAQTAVAVKNAYLAAGLSGEQALDAVDRLWKAEKQGGDAVKKVIEEINRAMRQQTRTASQANAAMTEIGLPGQESSMTGGGVSGLPPGVMTADARAAAQALDVAAVNMAAFTKATSDVGVEIGNLLVRMQALGRQIQTTMLATMQAFWNPSAPKIVPGGSGYSDGTPFPFMPGLAPTGESMLSGDATRRGGGQAAIDALNAGQGISGDVVVYVAKVVTQDAASFATDLPTEIRRSGKLRDDMRIVLGVA